MDLSSQTVFEQALLDFNPPFASNLSLGNTSPNPYYSSLDIDLEGMWGAPNFTDPQVKNKVPTMMVSGPPNFIDMSVKEVVPTDDTQQKKTRSWRIISSSVPIQKVVSSFVLIKKKRQSKCKERNRFAAAKYRDTQKVRSKEMMQQIKLLEKQLSEMEKKEEQLTEKTKLLQEEFAVIQKTNAALIAELHKIGSMW